MGWLSGYAYRAKIPCTATTAGAQTNYAKTLAVIKGSGSNSAGTIYLNNHALNWPNDVRFTKSDGTTLLDHYREEYDSTDGTWWIELDSIASSGDTDFYIYYGKSSDSDGSNGDNTFILFDDFEGGNFNRWTSYGTNWSVQNSVKFEGSYAAQAFGTADRLLKKTVSTNSIRYKFRCYYSSTGTIFYMVLPKVSTGNFMYALGMNNGHFKYFPGGAWSNLPTDMSYSASTWYEVECIIDFEQGLFRWYIGGESKGTATLKDSAGNTLGSSHSLSEVNFYGNSDGSSYGYIDAIKISKYIYPEPEWATPNSEEADSGSSSIIPILMNQYRFRRS